MNKVVRTERGWAGHFICAQRCRFRRNTLLDNGKNKIVVSTVGLMESLDIAGTFLPIGNKRYYETMAFECDCSDKRFFDADVSRPVDFDSPWSISELDAEDKANDMHELVVTELSERLQGEIN